MLKIPRPLTLLYAVALLSFPRAGIAGHQVAKSKSRVIVGATIIDGSGRSPFRANVRMTGDRIAKVGRFVARAGEEVIQGRGLAVAPGFIDIHNHSEDGLARE